MLRLLAMMSVRSAVRRCMGSNGGSISVEFGLFLPILLLLILGAVEFGRFGVEYTRLVSAARAGAQYAIQDQSAAADTNGITQSVRDDAGDVDEILEVNTRRYCLCPTTNEEVDCATSCSDSKYPPMYVDVGVANNLAKLFPYMGKNDLKLAVTTTMRIR